LKTPPEAKNNINKGIRKFIKEVLDKILKKFFMKVLPLFFKGRGARAGHVYRQIFRYKDVAVYHNGDEFEIVRIMVQKSAVKFIKNKRVVRNEKELYPRLYNWGIHGFSAKSCAYACTLANKLLKKRGYDHTIEVGVLKEMAGKTGIRAIDL
jgi:hypothetical protein